jgi:hypothetical protein
MMIKIKLTGALHVEMLQDLKRPHPFAAERIGFVMGRMGTLVDGRLILLTSYRVIPDNEYLEDLKVGARIGREAITWAMQAAYHGRAKREGVFHVHLHGHRGRTGMSGTDSREIPPMISGFQSVGREAAHGIIILSHNHGAAWVSLPGRDESIQAANISVIGCPIGVFEQGAER